jgi:hypothetical protein
VTLKTAPSSDPAQPTIAVTWPPSLVRVEALVALADSTGEPAGAGGVEPAVEQAENNNATGRMAAASVRAFMARP